MARKTKGQTSIEFIIVVGFLLFFFVVFSLAINSHLSDRYREKEELSVKNIALIVQDELNLAVKATPGYSREFSLPSQISGTGYSLEVISDMIQIKSGRTALALPINQEVKINPAINITKGKNKIQKNESGVYLNY